MLITKVSKDQFQVRAYQENNPKHTNIDKLINLRESDFFKENCSFNLSDQKLLLRV